MSNDREPSIEMTEEDVAAAALSLKNQWQQPPNGLVVPPRGVWSRVEAARSAYPQIPVEYTELTQLFTKRFSGNDFREKGAMTTATAHAYEVARRSGVFGRSGTSIDVFADEVMKDCLLVVGTIFGSPRPQSFEIAREGEWSYDDLIARKKALDEVATQETPPPAYNLTRHLIFWSLMAMVIIMCLVALVTKLIMIAVVGLAIFAALGIVLFFTKLYRT